MDREQADRVSRSKEQGNCAAHISDIEECVIEWHRDGILDDSVEEIYDSALSYLDDAGWVYVGEKSAAMEAIAKTLTDLGYEITE